MGDFFTPVGEQPRTAKTDLLEEFSSYAAYAADRLRSEHSTMLYGLSDIFRSNCKSNLCTREPEKAVKSGLQLGISPSRRLTSSDHCSPVT